MSKIAPTLQRLVYHWKDCFEDRGERATAIGELRDLLALERSVRRHIRVFPEDAHGGMARALARLSRAGRGRGR